MAEYGETLDQTVKAFLCWGNTLKRRQDWRADPDRGGTDLFDRVTKLRRDVLHLTECDVYARNRRLFTVHYHEHLEDEEDGLRHKQRHFCPCKTKLYSPERLEVQVNSLAVIMGYMLDVVQPDDEDEDYDWAVENGDEFRRHCRDSPNHASVCDLIDPRTDDDDNRRLHFYGV